jgi:uncharacterized lipoprotein
MLPKLLGLHGVVRNFASHPNFKGFMNQQLVMTRVLLIVVAVLMTAGCFNRDRQPVYTASEEVEEIRVPPELSTPRVRTTYQVPGYYLPELAAVGDEARPPRVLTSAEAERSSSHIRFGPTGLYLRVEDEPDSVWRRLSFALNRGGMSVRAVDEPARRYRVRYDHDPIHIDRTGLARFAFWRRNETLNYSGEYLFEVHTDGSSHTRVSLLDSNGNVIDMERAEFVLSVLRDRLG